MNNSRLKKSFNNNFFKLFSLISSIKIFSATEVHNHITYLA